MTGFMFIGAIFAVLVVGAILVVAFLVIRAQSPAPHPMIGETALQILDRRFASGEISADEYKTARDLLAGSGPKT
jgi:uncharacterized membrane protein